jgi:hypothetical protein
LNNGDHGLLAIGMASIILRSGGYVAMVGIKPNGMDSSHFFGI